MRETVLRLDRISKRFGTLVANDAVTVELVKGEVLALLGENGAGKTTLMNILFGHYVPDAGEVSVFGKPLPPGRPRAAIAAGIGMVHQHFALAPNLTVLDNVMVGTERLWSLGSDRRAGRAKLAALSERFGLAVDPDARLSDLSVGEQQRVEILKSLYRDARILILDEPTAVLTAPEAAALYATLRHMASEGLSLIFISHKLNEVLGAADRIVVLRGGKVVAERQASGTTADELAELMVGRRVERPQRQPRAPGAVLLKADTVNAGPRLKGLSFEVRAGETLGIVGVSGNGQSDLGALLSGLLKPSAGRLEIDGQHLPSEPRAFLGAGVGRVPEDRHAEGAIGELSLWENAILERVRERRFSMRGFVRRAAAKAFAKRVMERFDVRGGTPTTRTRLLSGGNMQKLILGRNLVGRPKVLVVAQPTRGLDEGAIAAVHSEILAAREAGAAVVLISEDLDEVLRLSDRVMAIVKGRLSASIPVEEADPRRLGLMMAGAT
ncbi:MAG: ABC transporter ATP-binding protein [Rhizobiaceae bacterium]|nr:ABC transporter ATP-binding protein [Rhizobiaceae bacterium]